MELIALIISGFIPFAISVAIYFFPMKAFEKRPDVNNSAANVSYSQSENYEVYDLKKLTSRRK